MKRILAGAITLITVLVAVWLAGGRRAADAWQAETPEARIEQMFAAADRGDIVAYLECFTGPERDTLSRSLGGGNEAAATASLRNTVADLKGWALVDAVPPAQDARTCSLTIERIYSGRVDRQRVELQRGAAGWQIFRVHPSQPGQPAVAYGTPVYAAESR